MDTKKASSLNNFQLNPLIANAQNNIQLEKKINSQNTPSVQNKNTKITEETFAMRDFSKYFLGAAVLGVVLVKAFSGKGNDTNFQEYFSNLSNSQQKLNQDIEKLTKKVENLQKTQQNDTLNAFIKTLNTKINAIGCFLHSQEDKTDYNKAFKDIETILNGILNKINEAENSINSELLKELNSISEVFVKNSASHCEALSAANKTTDELITKTFNELSDKLNDLFAENFKRNNVAIANQEAFSKTLSDISKVLETYKELYSKGNNKAIEQISKIEKEMSQKFLSLEENITKSVQDNNNKEIEAQIEIVKKTSDNIRAALEEIKQSIEQGNNSNNEAELSSVALEKVSRELSEKIDEISSKIDKGPAIVVNNASNEEKINPSRIIFERGTAYQNNMPYSGEIKNRMSDDTEVLRHYSNGTLVRSRRYNPFNGETVFVKEYSYSSKSDKACAQNQYKYNRVDSNTVRVLKEQKERNYYNTITYEDDKKPWRAFTISDKDPEKKTIVERVRYAPSIGGDVLLDASGDKLRVVKLKQDKGFNIVSNHNHELIETDTSADNYNVFRIDSRFIT